MYSSIAAGTIIVLGVLITVLGFLGAGSMAWVGIGLGAILGGGVLSLLWSAAPPADAHRFSALPRRYRNATAIVAAPTSMATAFGTTIAGLRRATRTGSTA